MAKPKGKDIVGWSANSSSGGSSRWPITVIAEKDVNQVKNRKSGQGSSYSKGHIVRQLGMASRETGGYVIKAWTVGSVAVPAATLYFIYTHSQVSNNYGYQPAAYVGLTHDDLEWLWMQIGKELFGEKEA